MSEKSNKQYLLDHLFRIWGGGVTEYTDESGRWRQLFGNAGDAVLTVYPDECSEVDVSMGGAERYFDEVMQLLKAHDELAAPGIIPDPELARENVRERFNRPLREAGSTAAVRQDFRPLADFTPDNQAREMEREFEILFTGDWTGPGVAWDLAFLYESILQLDEMLQRFGHLNGRQMLLEIPPVVNEYIGEAAKAYRHGLDKACIAMCRAALEEGLRDAITIKFGPQYLTIKSAEHGETDASLGHMIKFAFDVKKFLDHNLRECAVKVQESGNQILHGKFSVKELQDLASQSLFGTRLILGRLYR